MGQYPSRLKQPKKLNIPRKRTETGSSEETERDAEAGSLENTGEVEGMKEAEANMPRQLDTQASTASEVASDPVQVAMPSPGPIKIDVSSTRPVRLELTSICNERNSVEPKPPMQQPATDNGYTGGLTSEITFLSCLMYHAASWSSKLDETKGFLVEDSNQFVLEKIAQDYVRLMESIINLKVSIQVAAHQMDQYREFGNGKSVTERFKALSVDIAEEFLKLQSRLSKIRRLMDLPERETLITVS